MAAIVCTLRGHVAGSIIGFFDSKQVDCYCQMITRITRTGTGSLARLLGSGRSPEPGLAETALENWPVGIWGARARCRRKS